MYRRTRFWTGDERTSREQAYTSTNRRDLVYKIKKQLAAQLLKLLIVLLVLLLLVWLLLLAPVADQTHGGTNFNDNDNFMHAYACSPLSNQSIWSSERLGHTEIQAVQQLDRYRINRLARSPFEAKRLVDGLEDVVVLHKQPLDIF